MIEKQTLISYPELLSVLTCPCSKYNMRNTVYGNLLYLAAAGGSGRLVSRLISRGVNPNHTVTVFFGYTPLMIATTNGHPRIVEKLLSECPLPGWILLIIFLAGMLFPGLSTSPVSPCW